jgi:hypothetical protein
MPNGIGVAEGDRIVLRLRALLHVPAARGLLADWHAAVALAYRHWREAEDDEDAVLRWADLTNSLEISEEHAGLIVTFLSREGWAFGSGGGEGDDWWREVRSGVRLARNTDDAADLITARDAIEYPPRDLPSSGWTAQGGDEATPVEQAADRDRDRKVMVVVGRDERRNEALFDFLRAIDLKPLEWPQLVAETEHAAPYIGQVLDRAMNVAQAVVVLFTPDDLVRLRPPLLRKNDGSDEQRLTGQPRPNVLFEAGMAFGRHPTRTVLVEYGGLRGLSDLFGRHVVRLERGVHALHELALRLETAGCRVDRRGESWLDASRFPTSPDDERESTFAGANSADDEIAKSLEPLERLLHEILIVAGHPTSNDVVREVAQRIANLDRPTRGEFFDGLPGLMLPSETIRRVMHELHQHGVFGRMEGFERYVLNSLP